MRFYYHNHNFEFARHGGTRLFDVLLEIASAGSARTMASVPRPRLRPRR